MATSKKKAEPKGKPKTAIEKLDDISPDAFDEVIFGGQRSPGGWKCTHRPDEPSPQERELWHKLVEKALRNDDFSQVALRCDEYDADVLDSLFLYGLMLEKRGHFGCRSLILDMVSDGRFCWLSLEPQCVAIYE